MKALLDFVPLIIFFYLYKTVDPKNTDHPLLQLIGSAGGVDNNNILVATTGLIISMLVVYGALFFMQKSRLDKQQWIVLSLQYSTCSCLLFVPLMLQFVLDKQNRMKE